MGYEPRSGNATVSSNAPILPAQAFVNFFSDPFIVNQLFTEIINLDNAGITFINADFLGARMQAGETLVGTPGETHLANNSLPAANINAILDAYVNSYTLRDAGFLDISGANMADPTGQGITNKNTLVNDHGWEIYTHSNPPP